MIRPVTPEDTSSLLAICESTGLFPPEELVVVQKLFDDYHASNAAAKGDLAFACEDGGTTVGVAYATPREMTDRTWELLMIMVDPNHQGKGVGSRMLSAVESALRAKDGRLLLVETISTLDFERTRQFYRKNGYTESAEVPDYYADGVGKTSLTKRL